MAVPQPTDARVPCPVCRSPIHPIAGRCKHCKADLAAVRQVRPAAGAALPPLVVTRQARAATPPPIADQAYEAPIPVVVPTASEPSQPILPPRPSVEAGGTASTRSTWKSWPVLVILLATIAIIAAVILMAFPPGNAGADGGKRVLDPPPAPERMDTNPGARSHNGGGDNQNNPLPLPPVDQDTPPAPHAQITPPGPPADPANPLAVPRHTPDPLPPADPDVDPDFGGLGGGILGGRTRNPVAGVKMDMMTSLLKHACDRAKACGSTDPTATMGCDLTKMLPPTSPPTCAAAVRCFAKIDAMDCSAAVDATSMMMLGDCMQAMTNC